MSEKTFYDWAMDELKLARKDADKHRTDVIELVEEIFHLINDRSGLVSYAAIKMVETLLDREPLTAVTDESDQWTLCSPIEGSNYVSFQHVRNWSLFKRYSKDGSMWITDVERVYYANVREDETDFSHSHHFLTRLIDTVYAPITFPYISEEIRVKVDRLDGDEIREDLPTIMEVISFSVNDSPFNEIGRYYRYNKDTDRWDEISPFTYHNHKSVIETTMKIHEEYNPPKKGCPCCGEEESK